MTLSTFWLHFNGAARLSLLQSAIAASRVVNVVVHAVLLVGFALVVAAYALSLLIDWHVESSQADTVADEPSITEVIDPYGVLDAQSETEERLLDELITGMNHEDYRNLDRSQRYGDGTRRHELEVRTVSELRERLAFLNVEPRKYRKLRKAELIQLIIDTELS